MTIRETIYSERREGYKRREKGWKKKKKKGDVVELPKFIVKNSQRIDKNEKNIL